MSSASSVFLMQSRVSPAVYTGAELQKVVLLRLLRQVLTTCPLCGSNAMLRRTRLMFRTAVATAVATAETTRLHTNHGADPLGRSLCRCRSGGGAGARKTGAHLGAGRCRADAGGHRWVSFVLGVRHSSLRLAWAPIPLVGAACLCATAYWRQGITRLNLETLMCSAAAIVSMHSDMRQLIHGWTAV
jgi:hypothetical protein